jgi:hypothetical protein
MLNQGVHFTRRVTSSGRRQNAGNEPHHFLHRFKVGGLARSHVFNSANPLTVCRIHLFAQLYDKCSMRGEWGLIIWRPNHVLFDAVPESVCLSPCSRLLTCSSVKMLSRKKDPNVVQDF